MEDEKRKLLTGFLGERWVDPYFSITCHDGSVPSKTVDPNRTFNTGNDMVALKDKIVEMGEWKKFYAFIINNHMPSEYVVGCNSDMFLWLMNPTRFCCLVAEWRKGGEE